jgi:hypothetical protein
MVHLFVEKKPRKGQKCLVLMEGGKVTQTTYDPEYLNSFHSHGARIDHPPVKWVSTKQAFKALFGT